MKTAHYGFLGFASAMVLSGCSGVNPSASIQRDLDANPNLKKQSVAIKVISFEEGYLTLSVSGFNNMATEHLNRTGDLGDTTMCCQFDKGMVVARATEVIRKRPEVKDIVWTAELSAVDGGASGEEPSDSAMARARLQATSAEKLAFNTRAAVMEYHLNEDKWPDNLVTATGTSIPPEPDLRVVRSIEVSKGRVTVVFAESAESPLAGRQISWSPWSSKNGDVLWACDVAGFSARHPGYVPSPEAGMPNTTTVSTEYLPDSCSG